jgi:hypothetical protein
MRKLKVTFLVSISILVTSCSSLSSISNGGYSDLSLNKDSNEYELKRLKEIDVEGTAFFGIPMKAKKKQGTIFRFNGINIGKSNQIGPILSMLVYTAVTGFAINEIAGSKFNYDTYEEKDNLGLLPSFAIAIPIAGIINNATWSGSALQNASWNLNSRLVDENPDVDVFLNPKYDVEYNQGIFNQRAKVKGNVMGAIIKTEN